VVPVLIVACIVGERNKIPHCVSGVSSVALTSLRPQPRRVALTWRGDGALPGYTAERKLSGCGNRQQLSFRVQQVGFGKHRDLTLWQLYEQAPDYIQWLRRQSEECGPSKQANNVLRHAELMDLVNVPSTADDLGSLGDRTVSRGMCMGMTYLQVYQERYDFIVWLRNNLRCRQGMFADLLWFAAGMDSLEQSQL